MHLICVSARHGSEVTTNVPSAYTNSSIGRTQGRLVWSSTANFAHASKRSTVITIENRKGDNGHPCDMPKCWATHKIIRTNARNGMSGSGDGWKGGCTSEWMNQWVMAWPGDCRWAIVGDSRWASEWREGSREWVGGWMRPGKNECIHERVNEQTGEHVKEQMSGFVVAGWVSWWNHWVGEWRREWVNECVSEQVNEGGREGVSEWVRLVYGRIGPAMNPQCNNGSLNSRARRKYIRAIFVLVAAPRVHLHRCHVRTCFTRRLVCQCCQHWTNAGISCHDTRISFDGGFKRYALRLFGSQFWFANVCNRMIRLLPKTWPAKSVS